MRTHSRPPTDSVHSLEQESGTDTETEDDFISSDHVRVVIRCRPLNPSKEKDGSNQLKISPDGKSIDVTGASVGPRSYRFACAANGSKGQAFMFRKTGKHIVECALAGFNGAIVAYGQTGSGKTFTMQGPGLRDGHSSTPVESRGIIQSVTETIFAHIQESEECSAAVKFEVSASYLEIYNENLVDLLVAQDTKLRQKIPKLNIREDLKGEIIVVGQTSVTVQTPEDCYKLLSEGAQQRHVGATRMNSESSRSHAVFTLKIGKNDSDRGTRQTSRLHLVDLAGSERQKKTGATGMRLKEASGINKSLSALGNVINALAAIESSRGRGTSQVRIPSCRDSKLTFLLKDSLGGNSKLCIIATISPAKSSLDETVSTLDFAKRCTAVRNEAVVNESLTEDVAALQAEVLRLQQSMKQLRLSLSKAKIVEMELRATASPQNRISYISSDRRGGAALQPDRPLTKKIEAGVQTNEDIDKLDNGRDILKSVKAVDLISALDSLVERTLEGEDKETKIEKLCVLLANAISREKYHMKTSEEMKRKVEDSHTRWMEMLKTNEELIASLTERETELASIRKQDVLKEKDLTVRRLQNELEVLQGRVESNPEIILLRHRVAALEAELEGAQDLGALSDGTKKAYEEKASESNERWLDMLKANNELMIALNERDKVLNEVRSKGLENVHDHSGDRFRKDLELLRKEAEQSPNTAVLRHRIMALEKELVDFAELSVAAQKEALETAQADKLRPRSSTVEFATEIGTGDDDLSEEEVMKSLNKIPASYLEKDLSSEKVYHGPGKRLKSKGMGENPELRPKACNCGKQSPSGDILAEVLNSELFREMQGTSIEEFRYEVQSPRRISQLDCCIEALDASVQGLSSFSKTTAVYTER